MKGHLPNRTSLTGPKNAPQTALRPCVTADPIKSSNKQCRSPTVTVKFRPIRYQTRGTSRSLTFARNPNRSSWFKTPLSRVFRKLISLKVLSPLLRNAFCMCVCDIWLTLLSCLFYALLLLLTRQRSTEVSPPVGLFSFPTSDGVVFFFFCMPQGGYQYHLTHVSRSTFRPISVVDHDNVITSQTTHTRGEGDDGGGSLTLYDAAQKRAETSALSPTMTQIGCCCHTTAGNEAGPKMNSANISSPSPSPARSLSKMLHFFNASYRTDKH